MRFSNTTFWIRYKMINQTGVGVYKQTLRVIKLFFNKLDHCQKLFVDWVCWIPLNKLLNIWRNLYWKWNQEFRFTFSAYLINKNFNIFSL